MASKILIIEAGGSGGVSHYTYNLLEALSKKEDLEIILLTDINYELESLAQDFKIVKIPIKNQFYPKAIFSIISSVIKIKPTLIHIQSLISARKDWIFFGLARLLRLKIIFTAHNVFPHEEFERLARGMKFAFKRIYSSCQAIITHSKANKEDLIKDFNISNDKIFAIPHGNYLFHAQRNPQLTKELAREKLGIALDEKVALSFGAIREYKGLQYLIPAFSKAKEEIKNSRLIIVGPQKNEDLITRLKKLIEEHKLGESIIFLPQYIPLDDIGLYFKAADLAVFSYEHTYGSGALHSAFAFAKPVIASDVGIFKEMVCDGKNGYLTPPGDIEGLCAALIKSLSMEQEELDEMGKESLHLALEKYNWADIASLTSKVYKSIIGKNKVLIVAPDFGPPYNERWKNTVKTHAQMLNAKVLGTSIMKSLKVKEGNFLIFNNNIIVRYALFLPYLLFVQGKYDHIILEGNISSRFNQIIYKSIKKNLLNGTKCIGVSYVTQKWIDWENLSTVHFIRDILGRLRYFIVNDKEEEEALAKIMPTSDNLIVIRPGIDLERYKPLKASGKEEEISFIFASAPQGRWGKLSEFHNKGLDLLLAAFKKFKENHPAKLYLIWRGFFHQEIISLIEQLELSNWVEVVDGLVDTAQYYKGRTVNVFPIRNLEGSPHYPMSVMESLACGSPAIVSNKAKISKIIEKEHCGTVIEPDKEKLYEAMCYCFDNYQNLEPNCRKTAEQYFDCEKNFEVLFKKLGIDKERAISPNFIEEFYDKKAQSEYEYQRWMADEMRQRDYYQTKSVIEYHLGDLKCGSLLEVGCGPGTWARVIRDKAEHLSLLDISSKMIELAKVNLGDEKIDYLCADFQEEQVLEARKYDVIFSSRALEYMQKEKVAQNAFELLNNNGQLYVITKNPFVIYRILDKIIAKVRRKKRDSDKLHKDQISPYGLRKVLEENGFKNIRVFGVVYDFYIPLMRFKIVRRVQLALSNYFWKRNFKRKLNPIFLPFVESYLIRAEK